MSKRKKKDIPPAAEGGYIEFATEDFLAAIMTLKPLLVRKAARKDYASFHIEATQDKKVTISVIGAELSMQLRVEALHVHGWGVVMVRADALLVLLGSYHEPRVKVGLDGGDECVLRGQHARLTIEAYDPAKELKAPVPGALTKAGWVFAGHELAEAIRMTKGFVDDESTRYAIGSLLFEFPEEDEGPCLVVTTDGRRLSRAVVPVKTFGNPLRRLEPGTESQPTKGVPLLRTQAAMMAYRLARKANEKAVAIAIIQGAPIDLEKSQFKPGKIQFVTREAVVTTTVQDGRFPNWHAMEDSFTCDPKATIRIENAARLAHVLDLATATTNSESKCVEITASGGSMMFTVESNTRGKAELFLSDLEMVGQSTVEVDALMLRQMIDVLRNQPVEIRFRGLDNAIEMISGTWWGLLMPLSRDVIPPTPTVRPTGPMYEEVVAEAVEAAEDLPDHEGEDPDDDGSIPIEDTLGTPPAPAPVAVLPEPSTNGPPAKKKRRK